MTTSIFNTQTNGDSLGLFIATRSSGTALGWYKNGSSIGTATDVVTGLDNVPFFICARNEGGSASNYATKQFTLVIIGSNSLDQAALYSSIQAYMVAIGADV